MAQILNIRPPTRYITINCPLCKRKQRLEQDRLSCIWFPVGIPRFCCEAMRILDSLEWNAQLDKLIRAEGETV